MSLEAIILYYDSQHSIHALQGRANKRHESWFGGPLPLVAHGDIDINTKECGHKFGKDTHTSHKKIKFTHNIELSAFEERNS